MIFTSDGENDGMDKEYRNVAHMSYQDLQNEIQRNSKVVNRITPILQTRPYSIVFRQVALSLLSRNKVLVEAQELLKSQVFQQVENHVVETHAMETQTR